MAKCSTNYISRRKDYSDPRKKVDIFYAKAIADNTPANLDGYFKNYSAYAESGRLIYTYANSNSRCFSASKRAFLLVEEQAWWDKVNFINNFSLKYDAAFYSMRQRGQKSGYSNIYKKNI